MGAFVLRRLLEAIPVMLGTLLLVFLVLHTAPGDPISMLLPPDQIGGTGAEAEILRAQFERELGLDRPLPIQFIDFVGKAARLDFGTSFKTRRPIRDELLDRLPNTLELGLVSLIIAYAIGIPAGIISARRQNTLLDHGSMFTALIGVSMPSFWLGFLLMLLFGLQLRWLPISGRGGPLWEIDGLRHIILPAITLGVIPAALVARLMRSAMLDVLKQEYITTARAKGLREQVILYRHAFKNACMPIVTILGLQFGSLLSGAFIIETVFAWPGVGRYTVDAITARDYPVVQGAAVIIALAYVIGNLVSDVLYASVDPRVRLE